MKLTPIKPYNFNFCSKNKSTKSAIRFDDKGSIASQVLNLEGEEIIKRYIQLKNGSFKRKLTDDEALTLAKPWSIKYADFCERRQDYGYDIYSIQDVASFQKDSRKYFNDLKYLTQDEIALFIDIKDNSDFTSISQILRYIRLIAPDSEFSNLTPLEAKYFAKKCASYDEIKAYSDKKKNSIELLNVLKKYNFNNFSSRERQVDNANVVCLKGEKDSEKRFFTFIDGKIACVSKSYIECYEDTNFDSTKRTTAIRKLDKIPYKNEGALFAYDLIEILNGDNDEVNRIIRTYFDKDDCIVYTKIYNLSSYPQDLDILQMIKDDSIEPSAKTTSVIENSDGSKTITQIFETKDATLYRSYRTNPFDWELTLEIKDKEGKVLYKTNRSFKNTGENSSITTINQRKYYATADDSNEEIKVRVGNKEYIVDNLIDYSILLDDDEMGDTQDFWRFCKTELPIDLAIISRKLDISFVPVSNELDSNIDNGFFRAIYTAQNVAVLAHEMGHLLSANNYPISSGVKNGYGYISENKKLKEIYQKELDEFNKNHSEFVSKNTIRYFGELGGVKDRLIEKESLQARNRAELKIIKTMTGLEEIVAETMYIKSAPNAKNPLLAFRTHFLMMHFPRTIAYIANIINKNCANLF